MQPLSRVSPTAGVAMGTQDAMTTRPKVAIKIAECVAEWAEIETVIGLFLALLLDADASAAVAMYTSVENRAAQMRMVEAAARSKLTSNHFEVVEAIMVAFVRPAMKERDRLAHWCWGYSPDLPEDLLLIDPDQKIAQHTHIIMHLFKNFEFKRDQIFVVTEGDLTRMLARFRQAHAYVGKLTGTVWSQKPAPQRAEYLQKLSGEPPVHEALLRLRKRKKNSQQ